MSEREHEVGGSGPASANGEGNGDGRRAAHERLSTGALARWARACATHPWRVVVRLGRHRRRPDRPRRDGRRLAARRVRDPRLGHAEGDRPARVGVRVRAGRGPERRLRGARRASGSTRPSAGRRSRTRSRDSSRPSSRPRDGKAGLDERRRPVQRRTRSPTNGRIAYAEAQFNETIEDKDRDEVVAVQDAVRDTVEPAGVTVEYNGEAEFPPIEQGTSEALGLLAAIIVLLIVFRTFTAMLIPIALAHQRAGDRVPAALHPRRPDRHQHDHADPRLDDRAGRRHRLLAVHRHALPTAPARRAVTTRTPPPRRARPRAAPSSSPA